MRIRYDIKTYNKYTYEIYFILQKMGVEDGKIVIYINAYVCVH